MGFHSKIRLFRVLRSPEIQRTYVVLLLLLIYFVISEALDPEIISVWAVSAVPAVPDVAASVIPRKMTCCIASFYLQNFTYRINNANARIDRDVVAKIV